MDGDDAAIFLLFSFVIDIRMEKRCRGMESFAFWERYDNGSVRFRRILLIGHSSILRSKTRRKKTYLIKIPCCVEPCYPTPPVEHESTSGGERLRSGDV